MMPRKCVWVTLRSLEVWVSCDTTWDVRPQGPIFFAKGRDQVGESFSAN